MSIRDLALYSSLVVLFFPSSVFAQLAENNVGIYFDESATTNGISASGPTQVRAYIVVTGCTLSNPMVYFWGGVKMDAPYSVQLRGDGVNAHTLTPDGDGVVEIEATFDSPVEITDTVVVADLFIEISAAEVVQIWCERNFSPSGFAYEMQGAGSEPWEIVRLWQNTDPGPAPGLLWPWFAACINGAPPVHNTSVSWGEIKSQYR